MLKDVIKRGTGRRARSIGRNDLGGKTGTTNDAEDTWFNGYNKNLVTSVWVGFSNQAPLGANAYGSNTPLPIWIDFMEDALAGRAAAKVFQPPGITTMKIDPDTGEAAAPGDTNAIFEFFFAENAPKVPSANDANTKNTIKATCSCGNVVEIGSTLANDIHLDVCSSCHPFYTGKQKTIDSGGRVERFRKRFGTRTSAGS